MINFFFCPQEEVMGYAEAIHKSISANPPARKMQPFSYMTGRVKVLCHMK
jgi:hypothetical protein